MRIGILVVQLGCALLVLAFFLMPGSAGACPVCYGASDSPMAAGVNVAILVLLGITGSVLAAFASFFLYIRKRAKMTLNGSVNLPSNN